MKQIALRLAVIGLLLSILSVTSPAAGFETGMTTEDYGYGGIHPDDSPDYRYYDDWRQFTIPWATRTFDARTRWNNVSSADFAIGFSNTSNNWVGWKFLPEPTLGEASWPCTHNPNANPWCFLNMDRGEFWDDDWYSGTGNTPAGQHDFQGVLTHEFGHWLGLGHVTCSDTYRVPPDEENVTMCYAGHRDEGMRSPSQDDLQGVEMWFDRTFSLNRGFEVCCDGSNVARYWLVTPGANKVHWCGGGAHSGSCLMGLNNNSSVPYPELYQFASGPDVDVDGDGRFIVRAWARAVHSAVTPRLVIFVRHWHGTYATGYHNHEQRCDSGPLTVGVWTQVQCTINLVDGGNETFQYGVRVTEKIDVDDVWFQDA